MSTGQLTREPRSTNERDASSGRPVRGAVRPTPSLRVRRLRALGLLLVLLLLVWGCVRLIGWASGSPATVPSSGGAAAKAAQGPPASPPALADAVSARTQGIAGHTAVGVLDLTTGATTSYQADLALPTASIVKVDILAALLLKTDGDPTQGQEALAKRMIRNSDNNAATALWKAIGGAKGLDQANQQLGLKATKPGTQARWGLTTTTVTDQLRLMSAIFTDDSPLDAESRGFIKNLMGEVADDQQWGVSAADDPGGDKFYVKNGWLPRSSGWIVNSVGEVEHGGHHLVVIALSDGRPSKNVGISVLEGVSADGVKAAVGS